jgi:hypothetical protein
MTANGKINVCDLTARRPGSVRVLITDDPAGREPASAHAGPDSRWTPATRKTGMTPALVTNVVAARGTRRTRYDLHTDQGVVGNLAGNQTLFLAPGAPAARSEGKRLGEMTPAERADTIRRAANRMQDELIRNADAIGAVLDRDDV